MKKMMLLFGFCWLLLDVHAQEFLTLKIKTYDAQEYYADVQEKEISLHPEEFATRLTFCTDSVRQLPGYEEQREKWILDKKDEILSPALDSLLSKENVENKNFLIHVYFNPDGTVFTVSFWIVERLYNKLPEEWLKNLFNALKDEKLDVSKFWNFGAPAKFLRAITKKDCTGFGIMVISVVDLKRGSISPQTLYDESSKR